MDIIIQSPKLAIVAIEDKKEEEGGREPVRAGIYWAGIYWAAQITLDTLKNQITQNKNGRIMNKEYELFS